MREWVVIGISDNEQNLSWFWFVDDEMNKEKVTVYILNKNLFRKIYNVNPHAFLVEWRA